MVIFLMGLSLIWLWKKYLVILIFMSLLKAMHSCLGGVIGTEDWTTLHTAEDAGTDLRHPEVKYIILLLSRTSCSLFYLLSWPILVELLLLCLHHFFLPFWGLYLFCLIPKLLGWENLNVNCFLCLCGWGPGFICSYCNCCSTTSVFLGNKFSTCHPT